MHLIIIQNFVVQNQKAVTADLNSDQLMRLGSRSDWLRSSHEEPSSQVIVLLRREGRCAAVERFPWDLHHHSRHVPTSTLTHRVTLKTSQPSRHKTLNQCWFNVGPAS